MTLKHYTIARLMIVVLLSMFISSSFVRQDFFWPVVAMAVAMLVLLFLRRRVKEVLADERDYALSGTAARWSVQIFSLVAVLSMFACYSLQEQSPAYGVAASVLAYATCGLMLLYSAIFSILRRRSLHA